MKNIRLFLNILSDPHKYAEPVTFDNLYAFYTGFTCRFSGDSKEMHDDTGVDAYLDDIMERHFYGSAGLSWPARIYINADNEQGAIALIKAEMIRLFGECDSEHESGERSKEVSMQSVWMMLEAMLERPLGYLRSENLSLAAQFINGLYFGIRSANPNVMIVPNLQNYEAWLRSKIDPKMPARPWNRILLYACNLEEGRALSSFRESLLDWKKEIESSDR